MSKIILAPSILSANFANLQADIVKVESAGCKFLHLDVMDGHFVPNITIGPVVIKDLRKITKSFLDAHLMIAEPMRYAAEFVRAGADLLTVHIETLQDPEADLKSLKKLGIKIGLALNPDKEFNLIKPYIHLVDLVLIMSVFPGFAGQKFIDKTLATVQQARSFVEEQKLNIDVQIDGGINEVTLIKAVEAGANIIVAGSAIFNHPVPAQEFLRLTSLAKERQYVKYGTNK
jgi:ribulose-phosphate 3-epimerase